LLVQTKNDSGVDGERKQRWRTDTIAGPWMAARAELQISLDRGSVFQQTLGAACARKLIVRWVTFLRKKGQIDKVFGSANIPTSDSR
jgi:hypothetical protein